MAVFKQERHVELVPGAAEAFVITNLMFSATIPDQLPHLNVFVIAVADPLDPKQDTLARVANIADLSLVPIGRDAGIAAPGASGIEFLSQASTVRYDTLETGNDAAKAFQDRVNALIEDWITFRTEFNAPDPSPASYTFPITDPSQKEALIDAYAVAKQARYQAQIDKTDADDALTVAEDDYTYKQDLVSDLSTTLATSYRVQTDLDVVITDFTSLKVASNTFYTANTGGVGAAAMLTALTTAINALTATTGYQADADALVAAVVAYQADRQTDATDAATALTAAQARRSG